MAVVLMASAPTALSMVKRHRFRRLCPEKRDSIKSFCPKVSSSFCVTCSSFVGIMLYRGGEKSVFSCLRANEQVLEFFQQVLCQFLSFYGVKFNLLAGFR